MDQRSADIISQVRLNLSEISDDLLKDGYIYRKADRVQRKLMRELKCVEKEFQIDFAIGVEEYDFIDEKTLDVKLVIPSWEGELIYKPNVEFVTLPTDGANYPVYWTIFDHKVYFRPYPASLDNVKIWIIQNDVIYQMDDDIPPETPKYCDDALILGICAEYDPKNWKAEYVEELETLRKNIHVKFIGQPRERKYSV